MINRAYKFTGLLIIMVILLGHHSLQAHALVTAAHDQHNINIEICEKIQSDEIQTSSEIFYLTGSTNSPFESTAITRVTYKESQTYPKRSVLSYKQLARSHL